MDLIAIGIFLSDGVENSTCKSFSSCFDNEDDDGDDEDDEGDDEGDDGDEEDDDGDDEGDDGDCDKAWRSLCFTFE